MPVRQEAMGTASKSWRLMAVFSVAALFGPAIQWIAWPPSQFSVRASGDEQEAKLGYIAGVVMQRSPVLERSHIGTTIRATFLGSESAGRLLPERYPCEQRDTRERSLRGVQAELEVLIGVGRVYIGGLMPVRVP